MASFLASGSVRYATTVPSALASLCPKKGCKRTGAASGCFPVVSHSHILNRAHTQNKFASPFCGNANAMELWRIVNRGVGGTEPRGGACVTRCSIFASPESLRWIFTAVAGMLMILRSAPISKSLLVPLLALQAPVDVIAWIRGEYGRWAAFLALLVRLFYHIPGELELPLYFVLLVITAPYQVMDFRGTPGGTFLCAAVAVYLVYENFTRTGGIKGAFQEGAFLPSVAIICVLATSLVFLFQGF